MRNLVLLCVFTLAAFAPLIVPCALAALHIEPKRWSQP